MESDIAAAVGRHCVTLVTTRSAHALGPDEVARAVELGDKDVVESRRADVEGGSGKTEVWRAPSDGSSSTGMPVNETLSWSYEESPDGRFLYFCGVAKPGTGYGSLWKIPVEGGKREEILRPFGFDALFFREEGLYFLDPGEERRKDSLVALTLLDTETSKITDGGLVMDPRAPHPFSLSPDGRLVLTSHPEPSSADLMLVDDFR